QSPQIRRAEKARLGGLDDIKMILQRRIVSKLIGAAGENQPDRVLQIAAVAHKILGQPFEQLRMARRRIQTKIIDRLEESEAEIPLPEAIDDGGAEARIGRIDQTHRQKLQTSLVRRHGQSGYRKRK